MPLTLSTRTVVPLLHSRAVPAIHTVTPATIPALHVLRALAAFVRRKTAQAAKG